MDLITVIVNDNAKRRKVESYLKATGLENYLSSPSFGTYGMTTSDNIKRRSIDVVFDDKFDIMNKGRILFAINSSEKSTKSVIDEIYEILNDPKKPFNTGIAFSININEIFTTAVKE